jgi:uncharacterized membrane protein
MAGPLNERGKDVTRLEAFVDAAFAFAVTMLVISVDAIPDSTASLVAAVKAVPAFAASFWVIAVFWNGHARWSRRYGLDDGATTRLSLLLVFLVLVYVYPLRMMFGAFFSWISHGWLPAGFPINTWSDLKLMFALYAVAWSTLGLVIVALYQHAWRLRDALGLSDEERLELLALRATWLLVPAVGLVSLLLTLVLEPRSSLVVGLPGMCYALMGLRRPVARRARLRAAAKLGLRA